MKVDLPDDLRQLIREHGEDGYPHEVCGAMIGEIDEEEVTVKAVYRLDNLREENRERRYEVTPKDQLMAQKRADEEGLDVVGFYHSHPDHPARPSQYDLDHAWPRYLYTIVSVRDGSAAELNTWQLSEDETEFVQVNTT